ncbi:MAG: DUF4198 domain-containing protein, partial [bacterium]|nr:DUF4198 domain-containing protein [bacterium]
MNLKKTLFISVLTIILLFGATSIIAHDFWLIPEIFSVASGKGLHVYANNGSIFPESLNAVAPERISYSKMVGKDRTIDITSMHVIDKSLAFDVKPPSDGQWYVGVEVKPNRIDMTGEEFNEYLVHDGLPSILELRKERDELEKPARELYQKSAKTLIQSGNGGPKVWDKVLGHHIEFIPMSDPADLEEGSRLRLKLLFKGEPLANAVVAAGFAGAEGHTHAETGVEHSHSGEYKTDSRGFVYIMISEHGKWYVRTTHMVEENENDEYDWHSFWATLTFEVK